jgi:hypothetical protein
MPFNSGNIATFTLGGTDLSQYITSVSVNIERDIKDIKPIGGAAATKLVGSYSGTVSLEGGYDPTLDGVLSALVLAATPATSTFSYHPSGGSGRAIAGSAYVASYRVDTPGDDTATWRSELAVAGTITDS